MEHKVTASSLRVCFTSVQVSLYKVGKREFVIYLLGNFIGRCNYIEQVKKTSVLNKLKGLEIPCKRLGYEGWQGWLPMPNSRKTKTFSGAHDRPSVCIIWMPVEFGTMTGVSSSMGPNTSITRIHYLNWECHCRVFPLFFEVSRRAFKASYSYKVYTVQFLY